MLTVEVALASFTLSERFWKSRSRCAIGGAGSEKCHRLPADGFGFFIGKDANATSSSAALTQEAKRRPYYFLNRCSGTMRGANGEAAPDGANSLSGGLSPAPGQKDGLV